jgi:hypothetical protein
MNLVVATDHGGFPLKARVIDELRKLGHQVTDLGTNSADSVDYPDYARAVAEAMKAHEVCFIGAKVGTERTVVPPFPIDEVENKYRFIRHIEKTEQIEIFRTNLPASYV